MKPHPRIRTTVKWGGAVATVLLIIMWIGSGWWYASFGPVSRWDFVVGCGMCEVWQALEPPQRSVPVGVNRRHLLGQDAPAPFKVVWTPSTTMVFQGDDQPGITEIRHLPLWPLVLVTLITTALAWSFEILARRRAKLNLCAKCGYDRAGLAAGSVCPECGTLAQSKL